MHQRLTETYLMRPGQHGFRSAPGHAPHPAMPHPHPLSTMTTIHVRWKHRTTHHAQARPTMRTTRGHAQYCDHFTIVTTPGMPLEEGQNIRILVISPKAYHTPNLHPLIKEEAVDAYDTYDPCIQGPITRILVDNNAYKALVVENQRKETLVREARIWLGKEDEHDGLKMEVMGKKAHT